MNYRGKRALDLAIALPALVVLAPIMLIVGALVYWKLGSPVFFRQQRPGLHGKPFTILKFRTMFEKYDSNGELLPVEARVTRFGQLLRSTSFDELPELINVVRGEMSIVGPRPLLTQYLERYTPFQARRHEVKPGITGWAQINGRNVIDWETRFAQDVWYVDNQSLLLDLRIILITLKKVLKRADIKPEGMAMMPEFMGSSGAVGIGHKSGQDVHEDNSVVRLHSSTAANNDAQGVSSR